MIIIMFFCFRSVILLSCIRSSWNLTSVQLFQNNPTFIQQQQQLWQWQSAIYSKYIKDTKKEVKTKYEKQSKVNQSQLTSSIALYLDSTSRPFCVFSNIDIQYLLATASDGHRLCPPYTQVFRVFIAHFQAHLILFFFY